MTNKNINDLKVYVADSNPMSRAALKMFLEKDLNCKVIGEARNGIQCMEDKKIFKADVVLMDCEMPVLNGFDTTKKLRNKNSDMKIVALTMHTEKVYIKEMIDAGFSGCVYKNDIFNTLEKTLTHVFNNRLDFPDDIEV